MAAVEYVPLPDPRLAVDGRPVGCTTRLAYGGAYQLTIWTIVPALALELHSSYLGHPNGDSAVSHLQLRPGEPPQIVTDQRPGASLPVRDARRLCLYDHLAALRDLVAEYTNQPASVEVADCCEARLLAELDRWAAPRGDSATTAPRPFSGASGLHPISASAR